MKKTLALILSLLMVVSMMVISVSAGAKNTWSNGEESFFDCKDSEHSVALRFEITGDGKWTGIAHHTAGDAAATCDLYVYAWSNNYAETVAGEPLYSVKGVTAGDGTYSWCAKPHMFPDGGFPKGEYLTVMTNFKDTVNGIRNYFKAGAVAGFKVYQNGAAKGDYSMMWQLQLDGAWYNSNATFEDTETPAPAPAPAVKTVTAFSVLNQNIQGVFVTSNANNETEKEVALRFATSEVLTAIYPYMAGSAKKGDNPSTMDVKVYQWKNNYAETVSGTPVVVNDDLVFGDKKWTNWSQNILPEGTELPAGEYLVVLNDMQADWAIRSYINADCRCGTGR